LAFALAINNQFEKPLSHREIAAIVRSVTKWIARKFSADKFSNIQRNRANRRWTGHVSAQATKPWEAVGASRAIWYRHKQSGKPKPLPSSANTSRADELSPALSIGFGAKSGRREAVESQHRICVIPPSNQTWPFRPSCRPSQASGRFSHKRREFFPANPKVVAGEQRRTSSCALGK
jgi:hypothetical protein